MAIGILRKLLEKELVGSSTSTKEIYPITSTKGVYEYNNFNLHTTLPIRSVVNASLYFDRTIKNKTFKETIEAIPLDDRVNGFLLHYYNCETREWSLRRFKGNDSNLSDVAITEVNAEDWNNEDRWEEVISLGNIDDLENRVGRLENNIEVLNNTKKDYLFEQADGVINQNISLNSMSLKEDGTSASLLEIANNLPNEITIDFSIGSVYTYNSQKINIVQYSLGTYDTSITPYMKFLGSKLTDSYYTTSIDLSRYIPTEIIPYINRLILVSSPFLYSDTYADNTNQEIKNNIRSLKSYIRFYYHNRKALNTPEESAVLIYKQNNPEAKRLYDRFTLQYFYNYFQPSNYYASASEEEGISLKDSLANPKYLLGKTPTDIFNYYKSYDSSLESYQYSFIGYITLGHINGGSKVDAFFGCFPNSVIDTMYIEGNYIYIKHRYVESNYIDVDNLNTPRLKIFLPKNEIINTIKNANI